MCFMSVILLNSCNSSLQPCFIHLQLKNLRFRDVLKAVPGIELDDDGRPGIEFMPDCFSFCKTLLHERLATVIRERVMSNWHVFWMVKNLVKYWGIVQGKGWTLSSHDQEAIVMNVHGVKEGNTFGFGCNLRPLEDCCI